MALYIPYSIFHLARLLYVRPETFGPYYVPVDSKMHSLPVRVSISRLFAHPAPKKVLRLTLNSPEWPKDSLKSLLPIN